MTSSFPGVRRFAGAILAAAALSCSFVPFSVQAQGKAQAQPQPPAQNQNGGKKPNILVIFGDDVGQTNISAYSHGVVGYRTPNIDRIAKEGMMFTDYYAENSCTAGRSTFITGQTCLPHRPVARSAFRARRSASRMATSPSPRPSSRSATPRGNSARTISAIGTSTCRPSMASTNSSATSTTSMRRKSRSGRYWPKNDPNFVKSYNPRGVIQVAVGRQDRGHRPADPQAHGDDRRRDHRCRDGLHHASRHRPRSPSSCG